MKKTLILFLVLFAVSCATSEKDIDSNLEGTDSDNEIVSDEDVHDAENKDDFGNTEDTEGTEDVDETSDTDEENDIDEISDTDERNDADEVGDIEGTDDEDVLPDEDYFSICGDGIVEGNEICDGNSTACSLLGIGTEGNADCKEDCTGWLTFGICKKTQICSPKPANSVWNSVDSYTQTWTENGWNPPDSTTAHNTVESTSSCRFKCAENYGWKDNSCVEGLRTKDCTGLPQNAEWNTASFVTQEWNGSEWIPSTTGFYNETPSTSECRFKCKTNYNWSGSQCVVGTRTESCTGLPLNAEWNTVSEIPQMWNGSEWIPSLVGVHNETPSTANCRFKCNLNYGWDGSKCVEGTRTENCTGLPANAEWNTASSITQEWSGSEWIPTSVGVYDLTPSTEKYRFICKTNYSWDATTLECASNTQMVECQGLPKNASWNEVPYITQIWNGTEWTPSVDGVYNEEPSDSECRFQCNSNYSWNLISATCVADIRAANCSAKPANTDWNDNGKNGTYTQTWNGNSWQPVTSTTYNITPGDCRFKCSTNYTWSDNQCIADTKTATCAAKPANTDWNDNGKNGSYTQTWNGNSWQPVTSTTYSIASGDCRYICSSGYHYESGVCVSNTRTNQSCSAKPANTDWNTASTITQTWSEGVWSPATTSSYNETPSTSECRFMCKPNFTWNSGTSICVADTKTATCAAKPAHSDWNDNGKNGSYTQAWNGSSWQPVTSTTYNITPGDCRYVCSSGYHYESGVCVSNTRTNQSCSAKPVNTDWNTVSTITQTWSGGQWTPSTTTSYNETPSTSECRFICKTNYSWDGFACEAAIQMATCNSKPANTDWNDGGKNGSYTQTWSGSSWQPVISTTYNVAEGDCRFVCKANYSWSGSQCVAGTRTENCTELPENAEWNTANAIFQVWNGSEWIPSSVGTYNPAPSTTECRFKCEANYTWDNSQCVPSTRTENCKELPESAEWNTASEIFQVWSGSEWIPSSVGVYDTEPSTEECRFICETNYSWNAGTLKCDPDTQFAECQGLPAANALWNEVQYITQTWNGTDWAPSTNGTYNEEPSMEECRFKCTENYVCVKLHLI
ncbi:MAG: hypothetical protein ACOX2F_04635 [bacterium]